MSIKDRLKKLECATDGRCLAAISGFPEELSEGYAFMNGVTIPRNTGETEEDFLVRIDYETRKDASSFLVLTHRELTEEEWVALYCTEQD